MLSHLDIGKELNKNLFIFPFNPDNIKPTSINLTASKWAWSLNTKQIIFNNGKICIPPNDTGLIQTNEVIYVTNKLAGTYHSKVSQVSKGLGHIGTTLDPLWCGNSLIAIHNHTKNPIDIEINKSFVTLILYYVRTKNRMENTNMSGQIDVLTSLGIDIKDIDSDLRDDWRKTPEKVKTRCKKDEELEKINIFKKEYKDKFYKNSFFLYIVLVPIIVSILGGIIFWIDSKFIISSNMNIFNWYCKVGLSGLLVLCIQLIVEKIKEY